MVSIMLSHAWHAVRGGSTLLASLLLVGMADRVPAQPPVEAAQVVMRLNWQAQAGCPSQQDRFIMHGMTREADLPARVVVGQDQIRVHADGPLNLGTIGSAA
jgi:hypothetical protein